MVSLVLIVLMCTQYTNVIAEQLVYDQIYNFDIRIHQGLGTYNTFYSNYTKLFYVFFGDEYNGIAAHDLVMRYCFSYDGINWNNYTTMPTNEGIGTIEWYGIENQDFYLTPDGKQLYLVNMNDEDGRPYEIDYRVYNLSLDGSLNLWIEEIDIDVTYYVPTWTPENSIQITVDNESRPYIAYENIDATLIQNNMVLFRGAYTNGSWITWTSRYRYLNDLTGSVCDELFWCDLLNTGDGKTETGIGRGVNWLVHWDPVNGMGESLDTTSNINYFDGNGWSTQGLGGLGMEDIEGTWERRDWASASVGNITIIVKIIEDLAAPDRKRLDLALKEGKNAWQNRTAVSFTILGDIEGDGLFNIYVGIDNNTDFVVVWSIEEPDGNQSLWYRKGNAKQIMTNATWAWQTPITFWQNITSTDGFNSYSYSSGGHHQMLPYNVPLSISWLYIDEDSIWHDYIFTENNGELDLPAIHYNSTLYNDNGLENDVWLFKGDIYTFVSYFKDADIFYLNFTDGQHDIYFRFDNSTEEIYILTDERFVLGEIYTNYTLYPDDTQRINITFIPDINIVDIKDTTVDFYILNEATGFNYSGATGISFNIYNLGGNTYYTFVGDGARIPYGSPFSLNATDGSISSSARAEQIFRKLQHISFLMELDMSNEWDVGNGAFDIDAGVGYVDIGIDYRLNGSWIEGFKIRIYVQDANVGHHNGGIDHDWVEWSIDFYNYDPSTGLQQNLQSQLIYSNHWGYEHENYVPDYYNRTSSQLWVNLWFDRTNASTTVAAQVNAYYHGVKEQGAAWWFGYGKFIPMISDYDNAKFLDDLYDEGGNITNCQKYDLMKFYIEVGKVNIADGNDEPWLIRGIEDMHREQAIDRMEGIDEPTFVETKVLDMPQTGFINAIKSAISGLSSAIWKGAFQFVKLLMGAVGALMDAIGLGEWWRAFATAMENIAAFSLNLMDNLQIALINSAILLEQLFEVITTTFTRFILGITSFLSGILTWYKEIVNLFTGGGIWNINVWVTLELGDWVGLAINLLPVWWFIRIAESNDKIRTLQGDISFVVMITTGLFHFLSSIIILATTLINLLLGLLPI